MEMAGNPGRYVWFVALYNARAARRSWQAMLDFFEEIFE